MKPTEKFVDTDYDSKHGSVDGFIPSVVISKQNKRKKIPWQNS
jgi:hypothetical protein